jgi:hypothetical protein
MKLLKYSLLIPNTLLQILSIHFFSFFTSIIQLYFFLIISTNLDIIHPQKKSNFTFLNYSKLAYMLLILQLLYFN